MHEGGYRILVTKPEAKRLLGRLRYKLEEIIQMNLKRNSVRRCVKWIHLAQDGGKWWALVNIAMNLYVSHKGKNFLTS
jgi:hypothetical protein